MRIDEYQRIYEAKHDDELLLLVGSSAELTDEARAALQSELVRRGLKAESTHVTVAVAENDSIRRPEQLYAASTAQFLASVMRVYAGHFWVFVLLMTPAVIASHYIRAFLRVQAIKVMQDILEHPGLQHGNQTLELWLLNIGGYFLGWLCFCVSYAAICLAIARVNTDSLPLALRLLAELGKRLGRILSVGSLMFVLMLLGVGCVNLIQAVLIRFFGSLVLGISGWAIALIFGCLVSLGLSRFALSVPAIVIGNCSVGRAMFLSDELTEGKWIPLASLLAKSVVGGYIASNLPFWIYYWADSQISTEYLTAASIAGVIVVEPIMFIGFCLMYLNASRTLAAESAVSAQFA